MALLLWSSLRQTEAFNAFRDACGHPDLQDIEPYHSFRIDMERLNYEEIQMAATIKKLRGLENV